MVRVEVGGPPQNVRQSAKHILFVEGSTQDGLDVEVLAELLSPKLRVQPLGPSFSVRSVATALHAHHPEYWFVIDRDDWNQQAVEASWQSFPDPQKDNLLIWRRKELESYFLEPAWLSQSRYFKADCTVADVERWLSTEASGVLYLEAANRVLIAKRGRIKHAPLPLLRGQDLLGLSPAQVADKLIAAVATADLVHTVPAELAESALRQAFADDVRLLSGGTEPLSFGNGAWRDLMNGKRLFRGLVNRFCAVPDGSQPAGAWLAGRKAEGAVAIDLLRHHRPAMPADFHELKKIFDRLLP